jgi:cell division protein FtsZ
VGATFDESLEGIIRVSVVATGIDHAGLQRPAIPQEARIAELTQKLRADQLRAEQHQRTAAERIEPRAAPLTAAAAPTTPPTPEAIEAGAKAAVAAALLPMVEDVMIRPIPPKPSLFPEQMAPPPEPPPAPRAFIPPAPERTVNRPRRMPAIDEFPRPAQAELRAKRGEEDPDHPEKRKVSLLRRLAAVGLGRREDHDEPEKMPANARPVRPPPAPRPPVDRAAPPPRPAMPPAPPAMPRGPDPVSEYARRPAHQGLDPLGRQAPVHNSVEDDQLEIPAFLRRQAN